MLNGCRGGLRYAACSLLWPISSLCTLAVKTWLFVALSALINLWWLIDKASKAGAPAQPARASGPAVASFGPSGLLLPYYVGVAEYIREQFDVSQVHGCGVSGGFAGASTLILGVTREQHWQAISRLRQRGAERRFSIYFMSTRDFVHYGYLKVLEPVADQLGPKLAEGRFHLGMTVLPWLRPIVASRFQSVKELIYACTCSMRTAPLYRTLGWFNGQFVADGAISSSFVTPERVACRKPLTISVFPHNATISPLAHLGDLLDVIRLPDRAQFDSWVAAGRDDARRCHEQIREHGFKPLPDAPPRKVAWV